MMNGTNRFPVPAFQLIQAAIALWFLGLTMAVLLGKGGAYLRASKSLVMAPVRTVIDGLFSSLRFLRVIGVRLVMRALRWFFKQITDW